MLFRSSEMITYVNGTIYNALPSVIKDAIINTTVVSGHGSTSGEANFTSTDKLYLLSSHEVFEDTDGNTSSGIDYSDTAYNNTRQLDYYQAQGITTANAISGARKQYNGSNDYWWLRSAYSNNALYFFNVGTLGGWPHSNADSMRGVSPAFRLRG